MGHPYDQPMKSLLRFAGGAVENNIHITAPYWPRAFPHYALVMTLKGEATYKDEHHQLTMTQGDLLFVFPDLIHRYGIEKEGQLWAERFVVFSGGIFEALEADGVLKREHPVLALGDHKELQSEYLEIHQNISSGKTDGYQMSELSRLVSFLYKTASLRERHNEWLNEACGLLANDLSDDIKPDDIASKMGMGTEAFRKKFKSQMGLSPYRYRMQKRMLLAQQLLSKGEKVNITSVHCGFSDPFHFSKMFKEHLGESPSSYRKHSHRSHMNDADHVLHPQSD